MVDAEYEQVAPCGRLRQFTDTLDVLDASATWYVAALPAVTVAEGAVKVGVWLAAAALSTSNVSELDVPPPGAGV